MRLFLYTHWFGLVMAILCGLIVVAPMLVFMQTKAYQGFPMLGTDAETFYLSRIQGVYKGCHYTCNPYIKEYGDQFPYFDPSISETLLAAPGIVTGIPVVHLKVLYQFLLPMILAFLTYPLVWRLTHRASLSACAALILVLGYNLLNSVDLINIPAIADLVQFKTAFSDFLVYARPVNPQFSSIIFLGYLHVLLSWYREPDIQRSILLAIFYGLTFYIYFFTYAFVTVLQGVTVMIYAVSKKTRQALYGFGATVMGILIGFPVLYEIYQVFAHPLFHSIPHEYLIRTHVPDISVVGLGLAGATIACGILYVRKYKEASQESYYILCLILAPFIMANQHVITGVIMQKTHLDVYYHTPVFIIILCFIVHRLAKKTFFMPISAAILLPAIPLINGVLIQYVSYEKEYRIAAANQAYTPVLSWLKERPQDIVAAPEILSSFIPLHTSHYVLWTFFANQYMHTPDRRDAFLIRKDGAAAYLAFAKKYGAHYLIEDARDDILKNAGLFVAYQDAAVTVYTVQ